MKNKIPELLAPAGNMNSFKAALNGGADAIYLAGKQFGARFYAKNFNDDEIREAVDLAHLKGVKVYVTVNTLIKDKELKEIAQYLIFLYEIGVDAILVQDIGVLSLSRKIVPDLKIHASTQMTIHNIEGIKWAAQMGLKRVVLPREMELSEIKKISSKIESKEIELEIFAHGALCYSYSGQCLMSSFIGGRSGNRGMCAQPCRKKYEMVFGKKDEYGKPINLYNLPYKDKYLLSTRDLSLYKYLDKITKLNLSAIKIEGRMRSSEYVAIVVSIYRKALDLIQKGKWKPSQNDIINLKLAFNRDFTGGYAFENDYDNIMGRSRPGNRGIYVGSLVKHDKKTKDALIKINAELMPQKGDGVVFISSNNNQKNYGMLINDLRPVHKNMLKFKVQKHLKPGTKLYLTRRKSLLVDAKKIIANPDELQYKVPVDLNILIQNDGTISLEGDFKGPYGSLKMDMKADFKMEKAVKRPLNKDTIIKQFKKTGGTPFTIKKLYISYPGNLFAPISELNHIRRVFFKKIEKMFINSYRPSKNKVTEAYEISDILFKKISFNNPHLKEKMLKLNAYVDNLEVLKIAVENRCNIICFNPFNINSPLECNLIDGIQTDKLLKRIMEAFSICKEKNVDLILKIPKITSSYFLDNIKPLLLHVFDLGINNVMVSSMGAAKFILDLNRDVQLFSSSSINIWNVESLNAVQGYFKSITISPELSKEEILNLISNVNQMEINVGLEIMVQGNLESLISKDCLPCLFEEEFFEKENFPNLFFGIKDDKKHVFPIKLDHECRTSILNSVELSLFDYAFEISKMGIDAIVMDFEGRNRNYAKIICTIYNEAVTMDLSDPKNKNKLELMKKKVKNISIGGITTGNFIRGTARF